MTVHQCRHAYGEGTKKCSNGLAEPCGEVVPGDDRFEPCRSCPLFDPAGQSG